VPCNALFNQRVEKVCAADFLFVENLIQPFLDRLQICNLKALLELADFAIVGKAIDATERAILVCVHPYRQSAYRKLAADV
jgi:hypothetical protein